MLPTHCMVCKDLLIDEYTDIIKITDPNKFFRLDRYCENHNLISYCSSLKDYEHCSIISFDIKPNVRAVWYVYNKTFLLNTWGEIYAKDYRLPWFEPDFSDYDKMINKLKTYMVFL